MMPRGLFVYPTKLLQLRNVPNHVGTKVPRALREMEPPSTAAADDDLSAHDKRIVVVELHRPSEDPAATHDGDEVYLCDVAPGPNGNVVAFSPALTSLVACNTDVSPLGSVNQAKSAAFYLAKYLTKDASELTNALPLLHEIHKHIERYPSIAANSGSDVRTGQHTILRLINSLSGRVEVSGQFAALGLLMLPYNIYSHNAVFAFIAAAIKDVKRRWRARRLGHIGDSDSGSGSDSDGDEPLPAPADVEAEIALDPDDNGSEVDFDNIDDGSAEIVLPAGAGDGAIAFVAQHDTYRHRPLALAEFSLYEFVGTVKVVKNPVGAAGAVRRPNNATFKLAAAHPQSRTHRLALRSKHEIPILAGAPPPRHPGPRRAGLAWRKVADAFASYLLVLLVPWGVESGLPEHDGVPLALTWHSLKKVVSMWARGDSLIGKTRLFWARNVTQGLRVKAEAMSTISAFRGRMARHWDGADRPAAAGGAGNDDRSEQDLVARVLQDLRRQYNDMLAPDATARVAAHIARQLHALEIALHDACRAAAAAEAPVARVRVESSRRDVASASELTTMMEALRRALASSVADDEDFAAPDSGRAGARDVAGAAAAAVAASPTVVANAAIGLNEQQHRAFERIVGWARADHAHRHAPLRCAAHSPLLLHIDVASCTGKSHFVAALVRQVVEIEKRCQVRCVAPTAIAASQLRGRTIHACFSVTFKGALSASTTSSARRRLEFGATTRILVIDEVSMVPASMFTNIDERLRAWFDGNAAFGGLAVVVMGDFFQIEPVGSSLLKSNQPDERDRSGSALFRRFEMLTFAQQMRAAEDPAWAAQLAFFRNPRTVLAPVKESNVLTTLTSLSSAAVAADPLLLFAPIITCINATRHAINFAQAQRFALVHGLPVVAFWLRLEASTELAFRVAAQRHGVAEAELRTPYQAELCFLFVAGAPAFLCGSNISVEREITNSTPCTLHSLSLNPDQSPDAVWRDIGAAAPGAIVWIERPLSVNVELVDRDAAAWPADETLVAGRVVIPVLEERDTKPIKSIAQPSGPGAKLCLYRFGVELAFSITAHKVQGKTLPRVIVDVNGCGVGKAQLTVASLYVALSRARSRAHVYFLEAPSQASRRRLNNLRFEENLVRWWCSRDGGGDAPVRQAAAAQSTTGARRSRRPVTAPGAAAGRVAAAVAAAAALALVAASPSRAASVTAATAHDAGGFLTRSLGPATENLNRVPVLVRVLDVGGGGDCIFRAVQHQINGNPNDFMELRRLCAASVRARWQLFNHAFLEFAGIDMYAESPADYWARFANLLESPGVWNHRNFDLALSLCALYLQRTIHVYQPNTAMQHLNVGVAEVGAVAAPIRVFRVGDHLQSVLEVLPMLPVPHQ